MTEERLAEKYRLYEHLENNRLAKRKRNKAPGIKKEPARRLEIRELEKLKKM